MRIIGINGVWSHDKNIPIWKNLIPAFHRHFEATQVKIEDEPFCHPWQTARLREFVDRIVRTHDTGTETLLVGHSMGGIVACASEPRFKRSRVVGIVTIFAPHNLFGGVFAGALDGRHTTAPIVSFGAEFDELVWWGAAHPQAIKHVSVRSNHYTDLIHKPHLAEYIAKEAKAALSANT